MRLYTVLPIVMMLLQREGRVTYHALTQIFGLDEPLLENIRRELFFKRVARDEQGEGMIWTGEAQPPVQAAAVPTAPPAAPDAVAVTSSTSSGLALSTLETDTSHSEPVVPAPESLRMAPEAERQQLTVMFCDLADSTKLSQQLDPEDLREVIRDYQETAAQVIHQFAGHIAQYLGDGLLIYFGWPQAHEDDAQRALHTGLGIVEAITMTLNPRLEQERGIRLAVRIGVHTGPVVVGEMGAGERHENLATGETVNIAARLEVLAAPNTVVISATTAASRRGF